jgi:ATP-dependent DNA helicase RecQ
VHGTEEHDATVDAQKVMSAVYRTDQRFGITHIVDILVGSRNKRLLSFGHDRVKTYGIGKKEGKQHWRMIIEGLLAHEKMVMDGGEYPLLKLTAAGEEILFGREQFVHRRLLHSKEDIRQEVSYNLDLFTEMQSMRREMADAAGVPPFVVFSDRSLHEMCSLYPENDAEFLMINGVGKVKLEQYGEVFMGVIRDYLAEHPEIEKKPLPARQTPVVRREPMGAAGISETLTETLLLAREGLDAEAICAKRNLKPTTIAAHIEKIFLRQEAGIDIAQFIDSDLLARITEQFLRHGSNRLKPVVDAFTGKVTYEQARIVRGYLIGSGATPGGPD